MEENFLPDLIRSLSGAGHFFVFQRARHVIPQFTSSQFG
jgi:hypothetical protein